MNGATVSLDYQPTTTAAQLKTYLELIPGLAGNVPFVHGNPGGPFTVVHQPGGQLGLRPAGPDQRDGERTRQRGRGRAARSSRPATATMATSQEGTGRSVQSLTLSGNARHVRAAV